MFTQNMLRISVETLSVRYRDMASSLNISLSTSPALWKLLDDNVISRTVENSSSIRHYPYPQRTEHPAESALNRRPDSFICRRDPGSCYPRQAASLKDGRIGSFNRPDLARLISRWYEAGKRRKSPAFHLRAPYEDDPERICWTDEFLSDYGMQHPNIAEHLTNSSRTEILRVDAYREERSPTSWGNSNWRGPITVPLNYLIVDSLMKFTLTAAMISIRIPPPAPGELMSINEVALRIAGRLVTF